MRTDTLNFLLFKVEIFQQTSHKPFMLPVNANIKKTVGVLGFPATLFTTQDLERELNVDLRTF